MINRFSAVILMGVGLGLLYLALVNSKGHSFELVVLTILCFIESHCVNIIEDVKELRNGRTPK